MVISVPRNQLDVVITCDPAISERSAACRSAVVCVGMSPYGKIFLMDYWCGRQGDPHKLIQTILDMASEYYPRAIGIETVGYQKALMPYMNREMASRNKYYPIVELKPDQKEKKEARILSIQPYFKTGQVFIPRNSLEFIEEYETFPLGKTVDLLDAFSYAVRLVIPMVAHRKPALEHKLEALAHSDPGAARYWRADAKRRGLLDDVFNTEPYDSEAEESIISGIGEFV